MIFSRRYGRIELFALPYQLFFEALAPIIELVNYIVVPLSLAMDILSIRAALSFETMAVAFNFLLSTGSVLLTIRHVRIQPHQIKITLFDYQNFKDLNILVFTGLISNVGYHQYLLY